MEQGNTKSRTNQRGQGTGGLTRLSPAPWLRACFRLKCCVLALVPATLVLLVVRVNSARGPYWLGTNSDPDYVYLINALALSQGELPTFADHPGTPAVCLDALTLRVSHVLFGGSDLPLEVLKDPELFLHRIHYVLTALCAGALAAAGFAAYRTTKSIGLAFLMQFMPLLSGAVVIHSLPRVSAEPLLFAIATIFASLALVAAEGRSKPGDLFPISFGVLWGVAMATKITALPLGIVPFFLLPGLRRRVKLVVATVVSFAAATLPVSYKYLYFFSFLLEIFTHTGEYGAGPNGLVELQAYGANLTYILTSEWILAPVILLNCLSLATTFPLLTRAPAAPGPLKNCFKLLLALTLVEVIQVIIVAKSPGLPYLVPALSLLGLNVVLIARLVSRSIGFVARRFPLVLTVAVPFLALMGARDFEEQCSSLESLKESQLAIHQEIQATPRTGRVVCHYGASSIPFALWYGNFGVDDECRLHRGNCTRFTAILNRLYPQALFYDSTGPAWDPGRTEGMFWNWSARVDFAKILSENRRVLFQGMAFCKWNYRPPGIRLTLIFPEGIEVPDEDQDVWPPPEVIYLATKGR